MRYRAKNDFISTDLSGERILIAKGDKVYVQQLADGWEVFSFYSRKSMGKFTEQEFHSLFGPESEFERPPRDDRFKGRNFGRKILAVLIILLPLMSMSQVNPVIWDWKAVRVDPQHFEFQIRAYISKGWWIYAPNMQDECPYSPIITFERSRVMKPIERITVLEYLTYASNDGTEDTQPPSCPLPAYKSNVIFMQLFKMPIDSSGTVKGQITFQAVGKYMIWGPMTIDFELHVGAGPNTDHGIISSFSLHHGTTGRILTTYPKGIFRKTWWFIRHPFGPQYISKKYYP